jgi:hypothetical protein
MASTIAPQIVTGIFALLGVGLTLVATAVQRRSSDRRDTRTRFHGSRVDAAVDLVNAAERYRHAVLAMHALAGPDVARDSPGRAKWEGELQNSFEDFHRTVTRFRLLFPSTIRGELEALTNALDVLRAVLPSEDPEPANSQVRQLVDHVLHACRAFLDIPE